MLLAIGVATGSLPVRADEPAPVQVTVVRADILPRTLSATGEITARDLKVVSFPSGGRVISVSVKVGDRVTPGQELARLDAVQQEQRLKAAQAALNKAKADATKAADDDRRMEALLKQGAATRATRDDAAARLTATTALVGKAEAELESAQKQLDDTVLTSPAAGIITGRDAETGLVIGPAQTAFELAAGPAYDAVFNVAEVILTRGGAAPPVVTITPIGGGETIQGHIREVAPVVDAAQGTVAVTVAIEGEPTGLSLGMSVRGEVALPGTPEVRLPVWALARDEQGPIVWVRDSAGKVGPRPVTIARFETGAVVIASGLEPGEEVVGLGANLVYPGKVTSAATAAGE